MQQNCQGNVSIGPGLLYHPVSQVVPLCWLKHFSIIFTIGFPLHIPAVSVAESPIYLTSHYFKQLKDIPISPSSQILVSCFLLHFPLLVFVSFFPSLSILPFTFSSFTILYPTKLPFFSLTSFCYLFIRHLYFLHSRALSTYNNQNGMFCGG